LQIALHRLHHQHSITLVSIALATGICITIRQGLEESQLHHRPNLYMADNPDYRGHGQGGQNHRGKNRNDGDYDQ
jgi:hypothetical protein